MWSSRLLGLAIGFGVIQTVGTVPVLDAFGIGSARATEFYSRRRVNGVWITGQFSKAEVDGELRRLGVGAAPEPRVRRSTWSRPAPARPRRVGWARARFQSLGGQAVATTDGPAPALVAAAPVVPLAAAAIRPEREAREAVPLVVETEAAPPDTRREHLRHALEAKAQALAATLGPDLAAPPAGRAAAEEPAAADPQPLSSTYDYRTHVRTTVYQNGMVVQETLAGPAGPPIATRRFVGMESPRPSAEGATTAR